MDQQSIQVADQYLFISLGTVAGFVVAVSFLLSGLVFWDRDAIRYARRIARDEIRGNGEEEEINPLPPTAPVVEEVVPPTNPAVSRTSISDQTHLLPATVQRSDSFPPPYSSIARAASKGRTRAAVEIEMSQSQAQETIDNPSSSTEETSSAAFIQASDHFKEKSSEENIKPKKAMETDKPRGALENQDPLPTTSRTIEYKNVEENQDEEAYSMPKISSNESFSSTLGCVNSAFEKEKPLDNPSVQPQKREKQLKTSLIESEQSSFLPRSSSSSSSSSSSLPVTQSNTEPKKQTFPDLSDELIQQYDQQIQQVRTEKRDSPILESKEGSVSRDDNVSEESLQMHSNTNTKQKITDRFSNTEKHFINPSSKHHDVEKSSDMVELTSILKASEPSRHIRFENEDSPEEFSTASDKSEEFQAESLNDKLQGDKEMLKKPLENLESDHTNESQVTPSTKNPVIIQTPNIEIDEVSEVLYDIVCRASLMEIEDSQTDDTGSSSYN